MSETANSAELVLETRGLSKVFAGLRALSDVDFSLRAGEIVGIIGPNGAGKSTFINVVTGLYRPSAGIVRLAGRDVTRDSLAARARLGLLRSFQNTRTFGSLTVRDALRLAAAAPRPKSLGVTKNDADDALEEFGLRAYASKNATSLPYGVQKILNLAVVTLGRPRVLFLDEPFAGVDGAVVERLSAIIQTLTSRDIGVAVVEHNIEALLRFTDRMIVLESGGVLFAGTPMATRESAEVQMAYLGQRAATAGGAR